MSHTQDLPPFAFPVRVYWEDTDAGGIVFYANHLKFFERARTEWLRSRGIQQQVLREQTGGIFVVSETCLKYRRPARLDDQLLVTVKVKEFGRVGMTIVQSSLLIQEHLTSKPLHQSPDNPVVLCDGTIRIAWVDAATLRPARMPATVLDVLASTQPG